MKHTVAKPSSEPSQKQILIVDDNESVTKALAILIRKAGFKAVGCHTGTDALSHSIIPAAAVIDIHLPDLSGLILAQKLRERFGPAVPIIVVSGDTSMETINSLSHVGATYFFSKPVNGAMLVERLQELVNGATNGSAG